MNFLNWIKDVVPVKLDTPAIPVIPVPDNQIPDIKNPVTKERLKQLKDRAKDFLETFGKLYAKNYGMTIFHEIVTSLKRPEDIPWKLTRRDFDSVPRTDLFVGEVYKLEGEGLGDFGQWKKVFIVERSNYNIDIFASEQDFKSAKRPVRTIQPAGYELVENVAAHYRNEICELVQGLGLSEVEIAGYCKDLLGNCWALAHGQRRNYVFKNIELRTDPKQQKGKQPPPININETTILNVMKNCVHNASPRDMTTLEGKAFDKTCSELTDHLDYLKDWTDDGTESEILLDLLMLTCLPELREAILKDFTCPITLKVKAWYKAQELIHLTLTKVMEPVWSAQQKTMAALHAKIDPSIRQKMEKINTVTRKIDMKIEDIFKSKLNSLLATKVTPVIQPLYELLQSPIKESFSTGQSILREQANIAKIPDDKIKRNMTLDQIPRDTENQEVLLTPLKDRLERGFERLVLLDVIVHKDLFEGIDVEKIQKKAEQALLEIMDAFVNTLETRLDNGGKQQRSLFGDLLQDYDHDANICQIQYMRDVIHSVLVNVFIKLAASVIDPILEQINAEIPNEMQDFLNIKQLYEKFVSLTIRQLINTIIKITTSTEDGANPTTAVTRAPAKIATDRPVQKNLPDRPMPIPPSEQSTAQNIAKTNARHPDKTKNNANENKPKLDETKQRPNLDRRRRNNNQQDMNPKASKESKESESKNTQESKPKNKHKEHRTEHQNEPEETAPELPTKCSTGAKCNSELVTDHNKIIKPKYSEQHESKELLLQQTSESNDLEQYIWFYPRCDRKQAEVILSREEEDGSFLVRKREAVDYPYALSVLYHREVLNILIQRTDTGKFALGLPKERETTFNDVNDLIVYHRNNPVELLKNGVIFGTVLLKAEDCVYVDAN